MGQSIDVSELASNAAAVVRNQAAADVMGELGELATFARARQVLPALIRERDAARVQAERAAEALAAWDADAGALEQQQREAQAAVILAGPDRAAKEAAMARALEIKRKLEDRAGEGHILRGRRDDAEARRKRLDAAADALANLERPAGALLSAVLKELKA